MAWTEADYAAWIVRRGADGAIFLPTFVGLWRNLWQQFVYW